MKIQFDIPPGSAQESNGLAVHYAAAKRQVPRWRWYLLLAAVLVPPGYFVVRFGLSYLRETTPAQVIVAQATLRSQAPGRVVRIAAEGQMLEPGQPVLELQASPPAEAPQQAPAAPAAPLARPAAPTPAWTAREATLVEAQRLALSQLHIQQERLQRMQGLRDQGAATQQELDNARFQELQARADVNRAQADVREHRAALTPEPAPAPQAALPAAPAAAAPMAAAQRPDPIATMTAPFAGTVLRTLVRKGDWVVPGLDVAILQARAEPLVHAYLPPEKSRYAEAGRGATLRFMDGTRMRAKVVGVEAQAQSTPADRVSPLTPRAPSIVVRLQAQESLPAAYRIHLLPLDVQFD